MTQPESADPVYLHPQVRIEPLIARWHAWPHLLSPVQLALHIQFRILPLLQSFIANPQSHIAANQDPKMYGGPFVNLGPGDAPWARRLVDSTSADCAGLIKLAEELREFENTLQDSATGHTLNDYYDKLPASMRGLVELVYDINHRPSLRFFEDLLYDEKLTHAAQQIMLHRCHETERDFFMSTPRPDLPGSVTLPVLFSDHRLDALAAMRYRPASFAEIARALNVDDTRIDAFHGLFSATGQPLASDAAYAGDAIRMRYFGHACVLFQTANVSVLFDPFVATSPADDGRYTINDLPEFIDYVVLTHCHQDHFSIEMLIELRHRIGRVVVPANNSGNIADPAMRLALADLGFDAIDSLQPFESLTLPDGELLSIPFTGEHADLNIHSKQSIVLTLLDRKFMLLIDSDGRDAALYRRIMARVGPVDVLFIGMECQGAPLNWLYEPLIGTPLSRRNNESRRLSGADCARASRILAEIKAPTVFVYAMGQEPWMKYMMGLQYEEDSIQLTESTQFVTQCQEAGIDARRLYGSHERLF